MRLFHRFAGDSAMFDDDNLVSAAGLVPVMTLADQTGLTSMLAEEVVIASPRIKSGSANLASKLATLIAGMTAGADSVDDIDLLRSGGMTVLFDGVYAPSTVGTLLREFTFGHAKQLESVMAGHLCALAERTGLLPGAGRRCFVDIESRARPVQCRDRGLEASRHLRHRRAVLACQRFEHGGLHDPAQPVQSVNVTGEQVVLGDAPVPGPEVADDGVVGLVDQRGSARRFAT